MLRFGINLQKCITIDTEIVILIHTERKILAYTYTLPKLLAKKFADKLKILTLVSLLPPHKCTSIGSSTQMYLNRYTSHYF